jgi:hypothetical protein
MVVALLALFVVLGGTGYAALKLPKNSVGTKQLKKGAVTGAKIKDNSVTGADVKESKLGPVPVAAQAFNSAGLGGVAAGAYARTSDLQGGALHLVGPEHADGNVCDQFPGTFCASPAFFYWGNYANGYAAVGYRKDSSGWVHLQGVAKDTGSAPSPIFYLPPGYRPLDAKREFPVLQCGATTPTYVDIDTGGAVQAGSACLTLDGINFHP